jgi:release factor glutamine methyltransferase
MTLQEVYQLASEALSKEGLPQAGLEAKWLLAGALNRDPSFIILNPSYVLSSQEERVAQDWLKRRLGGEPLSRLRGTREFWSLPFALNEHTLDPRPDTEILVEGVLSWIGGRKNDPWSILDLGTGSGCILISLLHGLPCATGVGVDLKEEALEVARHNAGLNGVQERARFFQSHWTQNLTGTFDIIVSNPPYIPLAQKDSLAKEVRDFDPDLALFGGEDGLACYRLLAQDIKPFLKPHGRAAFEIGEGQRAAVEILFEEAGFKVGGVLPDLAGIDRVILFGFEDIVN